MLQKIRALPEHPGDEPKDLSMSDPFEQFVEEHYQAAYRFALSLCSHEADASDLTQQAFCIAQAKFHQLRDRTKQKSWLFTILMREFLRSLRHRASHPHHSLELVEAELPLISVDHAMKIDSSDLVATLLALDEHFRVPLALFYFEQLSYKEIADILEVPIGTVMSRLARGKELLRQSLEKTGGRQTVQRGLTTRLTSGPPMDGAAN